MERRRKIEMIKQSNISDFVPLNMPSLCNTPIKGKQVVEITF